MPIYLLRKTRADNLHLQSGSRRLSRFDVDDIRRWARTDGFGLSIAAQANAMRREYPHVNGHTLRDVLTNESWYDPGYDREVPLPQAAAPSYGYLAAWVALLQILLGEVLCSPSRSHVR